MKSFFTVIFLLLSFKMNVIAYCDGRTFTQTYYEKYLLDTSVIFVKGVKVENYYHGIKLKILENYSGHSIHDTIVIWYCNPDQITECNMSDFQDTYNEQDTLICMVGKTMLLGNIIDCDSCPGGRDTLDIEKEEDYAVIHCYPSICKYSQNTVTGWIFEFWRDTTISYSHFEDIFITGNKTYTPMLGETNTWYIANQNQDYYSTQIISTVGDTVFDNMDFKVTDHSVYLREDTVTRKVFARYTNSDADILIYDFSLITGNYASLKIDDESYAKMYATFIGVTNTLAGPSKTIYLKDPRNNWNEQPVWIEGIGSVGNLFNSAYSPDIDHMGELSCFYRDGELIYQSDLATNAKSCILTPNNNYSQLWNSKNIEVYPNPFNEYIQISGKIQEEFSIEIIDISGKIKYKNLIRIDNSILINTEEFAAGVYAVKIQGSMTGQNYKSIIIIKGL